MHESASRVGESKEERGPLRSPESKMGYGRRQTKQNPNKNKTKQAKKTSPTFKGRAPSKQTAYVPMNEEILQTSKKQPNRHHSKIAVKVQNTDRSDVEFKARF